MILLTTSDYFPTLGGLSTFTENIERVLKELDLEYKLFHWKNYKEIQNITSLELSRYSLIINIHPQFAWLSRSHHELMINFIHGSEIMMTSPNFLWKIYKKINKSFFFNKLEKSYLNIFISEATKQKAICAGYLSDYSRDIIFHNCIDTQHAQYVKKEIHNKIVFSCIVRNVAHKNLSGSLKFCELVAEVTGCEIELIVPQNTGVFSSKIRIRELEDCSNLERDNAYKSSHYNLLLSHDHSTKGFFEGFGLTILEAAQFGTPSIVMNTGGLSEAVHSGVTGWVIDGVSRDIVKSIFIRDYEIKYNQLSYGCYKHTLESHSLAEYSKLFKVIFVPKEVA